MLVKMTMDIDLVATAMKVERGSSTASRERNNTIRLNEVLRASSYWTSQISYEAAASLENKQSV